MQRIVRLEIKHCGSCPHGHRDANTTRRECRKAGDAMCYWYDSDEEDRHAFIPDWCPLWNEQGKPMSNNGVTGVTTNGRNVP